jgi:rod shape-determining protein MreC
MDDFSSSNKNLSRSVGGLRSLIVPILLSLALIWVFNRPLTAVSLFGYRITGAFIHNSYDSIKHAQKEAADLLSAQRKANKLEFTNKLLTIENTELKSQIDKTPYYEQALNFKNSFNYKTVFARILGRSPDAWHKQIIIDKGSKDGITVGRGVITEKGIVGQVMKVGYGSSIVQLVFNPEWRMGVKLARLNQYGVLNGNYPDLAFLQFITVDSEVAVGDEIVTSGICIDTDNCPYPENFPVGRVVEVKHDPNVVDLVVKVKFYEDLSRIREVFVINAKI